MKWKTDYDPQRNVLCHTITGEITMSRVAQALESLRAREDIGEQTRSLADLRQSTIGLTPKQLRDLVCQLEGDAAIQIRGRLAIVANRPSATALALLFTRYTAGYRECQVFSTIEAANAWLEDDSPAPRPPGGEPSPTIS